jgi:acyl carrier protein
MTQLEPLSFEAFQAMLADLLNVDVAQLAPEAYFITDLGVDSLRMVQMLLRLEEMGIGLSLESAWRIQTVGDAYHYYQQQTKKHGKDRDSRF